MTCPRKPLKKSLDILEENELSLFSKSRYILSILVEFKDIRDKYNVEMAGEDETLANLSNVLA